MGLESKAARCLLPQLAATPHCFRYLENLDLSGTTVGAGGVKALAAFLGCVVTGLGGHFPGAIDLQGDSFASVGTGQLLEFWDKTPAAGRLQMAFVKRASGVR